MTIVFNILLFLHILGASMVVGIWIANIRQPLVHRRQFDGALVQVITGVAMMGILPLLPDASPNYAKLGIKFVIGLIVAVAAFIAVRKQKKGETVSVGLAHAVGGLGLVNVAIATLWS